MGDDVVGAIMSLFLGESLPRIVTRLCLAWVVSQCRGPGSIHLADEDITMLDDVERRERAVVERKEEGGRFDRLSFGQAIGGKGRSVRLEALKVRSDWRMVDVRWRGTWAGDACLGGKSGAVLEVSRWESGTWQSGWLLDLPSLKAVGGWAVGMMPFGLVAAISSRTFGPRSVSADCPIATPCSA